MSNELVRDSDAPLAFGLAPAPRVGVDRPKLAPVQGAFAEPDARWGPCVYTPLKQELNLQGS